MATEISLRKLEANRRNAQKSTGPRTERGQMAVRLNALKHGFFSDVVVGRGDGKKARKRFSALLGSLQRELRPVGLQEELFVERIAGFWFKLHRILACEQEELSLTGLREDARQDESLERRHRAGMEAMEVLRVNFRHGYSFPSQEQALDLAAARMRLRESFYGLRFLQSIVIGARVLIEANKLTNYAVRRIVNYFGDHPFSFGEKLLRALSSPITESDDERVMVSEDSRKDLLAAIDTEWSQLREEYETLDKKCWQKKRSTILPEPEIVNHLSRYETEVERRMYRALAELERLQRARLGEFVPPPLKLEVNES